MAVVPKIRIDFENLETISDRVLLWELCRRHKADWFSEGMNWYSRIVNIPIDQTYEAKIKMSEKAYNTLMGFEDTP